MKDEAVLLVKNFQLEDFLYVRFEENFKGIILAVVVGGEICRSIDIFIGWYDDLLFKCIGIVGEVVVYCSQEIGGFEQGCCWFGVIIVI